jgi:hypothetical protein
MSTSVDSASQLRTPEQQVDPISPNVEQMNMMLGQPLISPMCTTVVLGLPAAAPSPTGNMVCISAQPMAPPAMAPPQTFYRVAFVGGIDVRAGPSVNAPKTGITLRQNEIFAVAETLGGATPDDLRIYLRLADGRGWVFDDKALYPNDPSVIRGHYQQVMAPPPQQFVPPQQFGVPVMHMPQAPAGYSMPPAQHPYPGQPMECGGMPCYPVHGEPGQMPLQQMNLQEYDQLGYPQVYAEQAPRKWKRGKRGGAKRRPKTQAAAVNAEQSQIAEVPAH